MHVDTSQSRDRRAETDAWSPALWLGLLSLVGFVASGSVARAQPRTDTQSDRRHSRRAEWDDRGRPSIEAIFSERESDLVDPDGSLDFDSFRIEEQFDNELYGVVVLLDSLERYMQRAPIAFTSYGPGLKLRAETLDRTNQSVKLLGSIVVGWGFASVRLGF